MTIAVNDRKIVFTGNGSTTVFAYDFPITTTAEIQVILKSTLAVYTTKTLTTHYTVSIGASGGNITMLTAPASGEKLIIKGITSQAQSTDYVENDTFPAATHETALDTLTKLVQEVELKADEALKLPSDVTGVSTILPIPSAGQVLAWNSSANAIENVAPGSGGGSGEGTTDLITYPITGTAGEITVSHGNADGSSPTLSLPTALTFTGKTVTGGTFSGATLAISTISSLSTDLAVTDGGTGASSAAAARTNLGLGTMAVESTATYAAVANNLSDIPSPSTARTNLGLGTMATQASSNVMITGGTLSGITIPVNSGGTNATTALDARANLGLTIGTDVQAFDSDLAAIAAMSTNGLIARTATGTVSARTATGTSSEITVTNGDGISGNPTFGLSDTVDLSSKSSLKIPTGTSPIVDASGKIAIDTNSDNTNITHGSVVFHDGTSKRYVVSVSEADLPSVDTYVLKYDSVAKKFKFGPDLTAEPGSTNLSDDTTPDLGGDLNVNGFKITSTTNGAINLQPNGTGAVTIGGNSTQSTPLRFLEDSDNGTNYIELTPANSLSGNIALALPTTASGTIYASGNTDVAVADGGTGSSNASDARDALGLTIGTNVQGYDAELAAIAGLTSAANKGIQFTGSGTAAVYDLTTAGKALLDDADASAQRTTLGLGSVSTQASDSVAITGGSVTGITDIVVADGGSGRSSTTAYAVICGGTTSTSAEQSIASVGTSGQVLTSNGASALPTFQTSTAATMGKAIAMALVFGG